MVASSGLESGNKTKESKMKKGKIVGMDGLPIATKGGIVKPDGVVFKGMKEVEPKALSDFVVCEAVEVEMESAGGILLTRGDGQPFMLLFKVHSIGPELQMNKEKALLKVGDNIMPISPEVIEIQGSDKKWAIFHESQIKAVVVEVE